MMNLNKTFLVSTWALMIALGGSAQAMNPQEATKAEEKHRPLSPSAQQTPQSAPDSSQDAHELIRENFLVWAMIDSMVDKRVSWTKQLHAILLEDTLLESGSTDVYFVGEALKNLGYMLRFSEKNSETDKSFDDIIAELRQLKQTFHFNVKYLAGVIENAYRTVRPSRGLFAPPQLNSSMEEFLTPIRAIRTKMESWKHEKLSHIDEAVRYIGLSTETEGLIPYATVVQALENAVLKIWETDTEMKDSAHRKTYYHLARLLLWSDNEVDRSRSMIIVGPVFEKVSQIYGRQYASSPSDPSTDALKKELEALEQLSNSHADHEERLTHKASYFDIMLERRKMPTVEETITDPTAAVHAVVWSLIDARNRLLTKEEYIDLAEFTTKRNFPALKESLSSISDPQMQNLLSRFWRSMDMWQWQVVADERENFLNRKQAWARQLHDILDGSAATQDAQTMVETLGTMFDSTQPDIDAFEKLVQELTQLNKALRFNTKHLSHALDSAIKSGFEAPSMRKYLDFIQKIRIEMDKLNDRKLRHRGRVVRHILRSDLWKLKPETYDRLNKQIPSSNSEELKRLIDYAYIPSNSRHCLLMKELGNAISHPLLVQILTDTLGAPESWENQLNARFVGTVTSLLKWDSAYTGNMNERIVWLKSDKVDVDLVLPYLDTLWETNILIPEAATATSAISEMVPSKTDKIAAQADDRYNEATAAQD